MPRIRDLGLSVGDLPTGPLYAIVDVPGIAVGHTTLHQPPTIHTGVTAIVPNCLPCPAGLFVGNGYGKLIGATQLEELGEIETPIMLTATLSAFRVADSLVSWLLERPGNETMRSVNPLVGETNDGHLSDIRLRPITEAHVRAALDGASSVNVEEGAIGAGSGTVCMGFKGGIGTSSRVVSVGDSEYTVGAIVQSNFGGTPVVCGTRVSPVLTVEPAGNSCMIVVATDAPLDSRQLTRVARRAVFAMGLVGASYSHGSGDYGIAISTRPDGRIADSDLNPLFTATINATEEALLNSMFMAETVDGIDGHRAESILPAWESARRD